MSFYGEDEVSRITNSWHVERPDLDTSPMLVFSRLTRFARHFDLERRQAFATHDLEPWEFDVLAALRRSGYPYCVTPGQLMAELLVSSGTMTNRIDRLEARGLVQRQPSPSDRRAVLVRLTDQGQNAVDSALETLLTYENEILESLDAKEKHLLGFLLSKMLQSFEEPAKEK